MSTIELDLITPQSGTNLQIGEAGDSLTFQNDVIPNSALVNEQITINGVAVNLGGSATIPTEHNQLYLVLHQQLLMQM